MLGSRRRHASQDAATPTTGISASDVTVSTTQSPYSQALWSSSRRCSHSSAVTP